MNRLKGIAALVLVTAGAACFLPQFHELWQMWTKDPLRSAGILAIPTSLVFLIASWAREGGWSWQGSWWGIVPIAVCLLGARAESQGFVGFMLPGAVPIPFVPVGLLLFGYASGAVLLLGGAKALRVSAFGLALLIFVNPVPEFFARLVDVPLQFAAARTARAFASLLHVPIAGRSLSLMFAPGFGMFIAPGCNGLRGVVSMGFLALVVGRLWGLRGLRHGLFVGAAVLLAYALNLARLCSLVLYYRLALWVVPLQGHAVGADLVIGATLFVLAAAALFSGVRLPGSTALNSPLHVRTSYVPGGPAWAKLAVLATVVLGFASLPYWPPARLATQINKARREKGYDDLLPHWVGQYRAGQSWKDVATYAPIVDLGALYERDVGNQVRVDLLLDSSGAHDPASCYLIRGERPLWRELVTLETAHGPATFGAATFESGTHTVLVASTECAGQSCTALPLGGRLIPLGLTLSDLLWRVHTIVPVEIVTEEPTSTADGPDVVRQRLLGRLKSFVGSLDLAPLQRFYGIGAPAARSNVG